MRILAEPLVRVEHGSAAAARAATVCAALAGAVEVGMATLCRPWMLPGGVAAPRELRCALDAVVADVVSACGRDIASSEAAVLRHVSTLAAAARDDEATRCSLLPAGLLSALSAAHAAAQVPCFSAALATLAWLPRGVAALCDAPEAFDGAVAALAALAASRLAAEKETLLVVAWQPSVADARYAASAMSADPRGYAARRAAHWPLAPDAVCGRCEAGSRLDACDGVVRSFPARKLAAAATAVQALLAAHDPACLVAFRRDGSALAALLCVWLQRDFHCAALWPDAQGYAALAAVRGDTAALVAYPAAVLLGPLRGVAAQIAAAECDACGGGDLPAARLQAAARTAVFSSSAAEETLLQLERHPAVARFRLEAG